MPSRKTHLCQTNSVPATALALCNCLPSARQAAGHELQNYGSRSSVIRFQHDCILDDVLVYHKETTTYIGDALLQEKEMERRLSTVKGVNISTLSRSLAAQTNESIKRMITEPMALPKACVLGVQATHMNRDQSLTLDSIFR